MGGKAKPTKHTAKEIQMKHDAHKDRAGGEKGKERRQPLKVAYTCVICMTICPDKKSLTSHYDSKHPKVDLDWELYPEPQKEERVQTHMAKFKQENQQPQKKKEDDE